MESQGHPEAKTNELAAQLHARCRSHDRSIRNAAFQQLGEYLLRIAYSRLRTRTDRTYIAEECTQQALVTIWQKLMDDRGPERAEWFMSWSAGIVIHKVLDELRKVSRRRTEPLDSPEALPGTAAPAWRNTSPVPAPETNALSAEVSRELLRLIQEHPRLSTDAKVVLLGGYLHEQDDSELAAQLNKAAVTIRVIRSRGLKILREDRRFMAELNDLAVHQPLTASG